MYKGWQELFGEAGVNVIMVMGEDASQNPAGTGTAASYKTEQGFPDTIPVVADGSWQKTSAAISHPSQIGLPFLIVLGGDMEILKIDATSQDVLTLAQEKTGITLQATCEGSCGAQSVSGCYCDPACTDYGDCCPDYEDLCL